MYILYFKIILLLIVSMNFGYSKTLIPCLGDIKTGKPTYILNGHNSIITTEDFLTDKNIYLHDSLKFKACEKEENLLKHFSPSDFKENMNLERFLINNKEAEAYIKKFLLDNPEYLDKLSYLALVLNTEAKEFQDENGTKYYEVNFEIGRRKIRHRKFNLIYQEKRIYKFYFYEMEIGRSDEEIEAANDREIYRLRKVQSVQDYRDTRETIQQKEKRLQHQRDYSGNRKREDKESNKNSQPTNYTESSSKKKAKIVDETENSKIEEANYVSSGKFQQELENNSEIDRETMERLNFLINLF